MDVVALRVWQHGWIGFPYIRHGRVVWRFVSLVVSCYIMLHHVLIFETACPCEFSIGKAARIAFNTRSRVGTSAC